MQFAFLGGSFAIGVFNAFNSFTVSLWLTAFTASYFVISLVSNSRSFGGALVSPLAGAWSDRLYLGWLGRRRPFILAGGLLGALLLALTPAISRLEILAGWLSPDLARLAPALLAIGLFTIAFNMQDDVQKALLADLTEGPARERLSSFSVVFDMGGQVVILVLGFLLTQGGIEDGFFLVAAGLIAAGVLVNVLGVREPPPGAWDRQADTPRPSLGRFVADYRGAAIFCLAVFCYWAGVNAVLPLVSIYTRDILGANPGEAQLLPALLLLSTTIFAIPAGLLGTRFGKRRVLATGYLVLSLAALAALVITTREEGAVVFLVAGIGNAASMVLTIPLLADLVPRHHMGAATGILAACTSLSAPLSSVVSGSLAEAIGPRAIFLLMTVMTLLALTLLPAVRPPKDGMG
ncbi:MAG: MFS transporter [Dehalococcoidia bacterium]